MIARVLLGLAGAVLALLFLEVSLRVYTGVHARAFVGAAQSAVDLVPDSMLVTWFKPDYRSPDGDTTYDHLGFRLNGPPRPDDAHPSPIALLGGSTAYGWGVADNQTISAYVEHELRAAGSATTTVLNAGFPGLTTLDSVLVYDARVARLHPPVVIVLAGLNDLYYATDWSPGQRLYWSEDVFEVSLRARHDPALSPLVHAIDAVALRNCFVCYYAANALSRLYDRTHVTPALGLAVALDEEPMGQPNDRAMQLTADALGYLARRVRGDGGCLIVAWQPMAGVPDGTKTPAEQDAVARIARRAPGWPSVAPRMFATLWADTRALFSSGDATEADLTRVFDSATGRVYVEDGVHYTPHGDQLIARALARALKHGSCTTSSASSLAPRSGS